MQFDMPAIKAYKNGEPRTLVCDMSLKAYEREHISLRDGDVGAKTVDWVVEGWASTNAVDRSGEVVDPKAFEGHLPMFKEYPIMLLNHEFREEPIGKFETAEVRETGLWVRGTISQTDKGKNVWTLINDGVLKAFSIGFKGHKIEITDDDRPDVWREVELIEVSVVNVPANSAALFQVAKQRGLDLGIGSLITKEGASMDALTITDVEKTVTEKIGALTPTIEAAAKTAAESEARIAVTKAVKPIDATATEIEKQFIALKTTVADCVTKAEQKERIDKVVGDLEMLQTQYKRLHAAGLPNRVIAPLTDLRSEGLNDIEKGLMAEFRIPAMQAKAIGNAPEHFWSKQDERYHLHKQYQVASDNLLILHMLAFTYNKGTYSGMQSLKYFEVYKKALDDFRKAMDTATATEGTEWIPTNFSSQLHEFFDVNGTIIDLFQRFNMPTKVFEWPIQTSRVTAYNIAEATSDTAAAITASTPGTSNITFTAAKMAARVLTSTEFIEDSIIPVLPFITRDLGLALVEGVEDVILNGDTATPHMDSNVTAGTTDLNTLWLGLRAWCLDQSYSTDTDDVSAADLRLLRTYMGKWGVDPRKMAYIMSPTIYMDLLNDTAVATIDKFGERATWLTGELLALDGAPVRFNGKVLDNLNASGVYDGVTETQSAIYAVNREEWMLADRRMVTVESQKQIASDQLEIVGTWRGDFQPMRPTTDKIAWLGYDVDIA